MNNKKYHTKILLSQCALYHPPKGRCFTARFDKHGETFENIEDDVLETISNLHRSSSLIENINSRIRVYLDPRKGFKEERFELIKFALNHLPRHRAANQKLKGKSAAEVFTNKDHINFMSLLGLYQFKRAA